jgi:hypothetical protein
VFSKVWWSVSVGYYSWTELWTIVDSWWFQHSLSHSCVNEGWGRLSLDPASLESVNNIVFQCQLWAPAHAHTLIWSSGHPAFRYSETIDAAHPPEGFLLWAGKLALGIINVLSEICRVIIVKCDCVWKTMFKGEYSYLKINWKKW